MSQLTIYKASAGSGKTFRLSLEYLKLLFLSPLNYKRILAVTFTNKATAEMKNRILSELNKLAKGEKSGYREILKNDLNLNDTLLQQKANESLALLLHDFSKFSVSTIDKFFQKIIRSFTRETGIQPGYSIELNQKEILSQVIDELLIDLDKNTELKEWLSDLASNKIEQGGKWDFKDDIHHLAGEIFKEEYKAFDSELIKKMSDKEFLRNYIKSLHEIKSNFEKYLTENASKAIDIIVKLGLTPDDFKWGKAGVPGYFYKIVEKSEFEPGKRAISGVDSIDDWFKKDSPKKDIIENALHNGLFGLLSESVNFYNENQINYNSSINILKYIHTLGILTDISVKLREYCQEQNMFLISDAAKLLQIIIDNNDAPFIYEKAGSIYRYFMIDEFQDTSKTQWHNFKPLVGNSLAQGNKNLLVGDIKQSIYRWRNSDWKILSDEVQNDFAAFSPESRSLLTNWRSKKSIIDFNNSVFCYSSQIIQEQFNSDFDDISSAENPYKSKISEAYHDVYQHLPNENQNTDGYVQHDFILESQVDSWRDEIKDRVVKTIENLQDKGFNLNDIAILVRSGKDGQEIANLLIEKKNQGPTQYRYDFISGDSLYIANSSLVRFIIAVAEYILDPENDINLSFIAYEFSQYLNSEITENLHDILRNYKPAEKEERLQKLFPSEFIQSADQLKQLPIYELIDRIVRIFELNKLKSELPYLQAFLDIVLDFSKSKTADLHTFINWWNDEGQSKTLQISENQDAIRIITVHSSKGLEFKNVIIPFCNWNIDHNSNKTNILWCKSPEAPFNQLDLIPVGYSQQLINTVFCNDYLKEKLHAYVDNLNLLYVALTRAEINLFLFSPLKESNKKIKHVGDLLYFTYKNYQNFPAEKPLIGFSEGWNEQTKTFSYGELAPAREHKKSLPEQIALEQYESFDVKNKLRLKLHDTSFFTGQEGAFEKINHGKVMHQVFENIKTQDDIPLAIEKLIFEGKISPDEKQTLRDKINETFKNEQIKSWFSSGWNIKTEEEIILPGGKTFRPDRVISNNEKVVVIDFKFGEQETEKHHKQVKTYMDVLKNMYNKQVEGYLWYVDMNFIRQVT